MFSSNFYTHYAVHALSRFSKVLSACLDFAWSLRNRYFTPLIAECDRAYITYLNHPPFSYFFRTFSCTKKKTSLMWQFFRWNMLTCVQALAFVVIFWTLFAMWCASMFQRLGIRGCHAIQTETCNYFCYNSFIFDNC